MIIERSLAINIPVSNAMVIVLDNNFLAIHSLNVWNTFEYSIHRTFEQMLSFKESRIMGEAPVYLIGYVDITVSSFIYTVSYERLVGELNKTQWLSDILKKEKESTIYKDAWYVSSM